MGWADLAVTRLWSDIYKETEWSEAAGPPRLFLSGEVIVFPTDQQGGSAHSTLTSLGAPACSHQRTGQAAPPSIIIFN